MRTTPRAMHEMYLILKKTQNSNDTFLRCAADIYGDIAGGAQE